MLQASSARISRLVVSCSFFSVAEFLLISFLNTFNHRYPVPIKNFQDLIKKTKQKRSFNDTSQLNQ